jgi:hypothetical protein
MSLYFYTLPNIAQRHSPEVTLMIELRIPSSLRAYNRLNYDAVYTSYRFFNFL